MAEPVVASAWDFGWEALVAIGTLALAGATFLLARATRDTASAAAADVRAQWRPAIAPDDAQVTYSEADKRLWIYLSNVGRGPAFYVRAGLSVGGRVEPAEKVDSGGMPRWNPTVWEPGLATSVQFPLEHQPDSCEILLDYLDVSDRPYSSTVSVDRYAVSDGRHDFDRLQVSRVRFSEGSQVTPWGVPT